MRLAVVILLLATPVLAIGPRHRGRAVIWDAAPNQCSAEKAPPEDPDKRAELNALIKERDETLEKVCEILLAQYSAGTVNFGRVAEAHRNLVKALLENSDETSEVRVAKLRKCRDLTEQMVKVLESHVKGGWGLESERVRANALLLEVKVEMLRQELKAKPK
jgi:hypothetical protein